MKVAIIGSRSLDMEIPEDTVPKNATVILSGGAPGIDHRARDYAVAHRIRIYEVLPDYDAFGRSAPLQRNNEIIAKADLVLAFWDGKSRGTKYVIDRCREIGKPVKVFLEEMEE